MADETFDAECLRRMYVEEGLNVAAIARALRVRKQTVCDALKRWEIPRRRRGPRRKVPEIPFSPGELRSLVARKGIRRISRDLHLPPDAIYARLGRVPLPRGTPRTVDDEAIWQSYLAGTPLDEIQTQFRCSSETLKRSLRRSFFQQ